MTVYETDIPNVGRKFELAVGDGSRVVVVIHHDGRRAVYHRPTPEADSTLLFELSGEEGRQLGTILSGAFFQPVAADEPAVPLGEDILEWVDVPESSPLVGETLGSASLRERVGVSIIAIQRGDQTLGNPESLTAIEAGDILVALGSRDEHAALRAIADDD
ncbi:MAG: cation:proton antiporter regulatory subunit [Halanaeroarchaeum sp.]